MEQDEDCNYNDLLELEASLAQNEQKSKLSSNQSFYFADEIPANQETQSKEGYGFYTQGDKDEPIEFNDEIDNFQSGSNQGPTSNSVIDLIKLSNQKLSDEKVAYDTQLSNNLLNELEAAGFGDGQNAEQENYFEDEIPVTRKTPEGTSDLYLEINQSQMSQMLLEAAKGKHNAIQLCDDFRLEDLPDSAPPSEKLSYHIEDDISDVPYHKVLAIGKIKKSRKSSVGLDNNISFQPLKPPIQTKPYNDESKSTSMCELAIPEPEILTQASINSKAKPRKSVGIPQQKEHILCMLLINENNMKRKSVGGVVQTLPEPASPKIEIVKKRYANRKPLWITIPQSEEGSLKSNAKPAVAQDSSTEKQKQLLKEAIEDGTQIYSNSEVESSILYEPSSEFQTSSKVTPIPSHKATPSSSKVRSSQESQSEDGSSISGPPSKAPSINLVSVKSLNKKVQPSVKQNSIKADSDPFASFIDQALQQESNTKVEEIDFLADLALVDISQVAPQNENQENKLAKELFTQNDQIDVKTPEIDVFADLIDIGATNQNEMIQEYKSRSEKAKTPSIKSSIKKTDKAESENKQGLISKDEIDLLGASIISREVDLFSKHASGESPNLKHTTEIENISKKAQSQSSSKTNSFKSKSINESTPGIQTPSIKSVQNLVKTEVNIESQKVAYLNVIQNEQNEANLVELNSEQKTQKVHIETPKSVISKKESQFNSVASKAKSAIQEHDQIVNQELDGLNINITSLKQLEDHLRFEQSAEFKSRLQEGGPSIDQNQPILKSAIKKKRRNQAQFISKQRLNTTMRSKLNQFVQSRYADFLNQGNNITVLVTTDAQLQASGVSQADRKAAKNNGLVIPSLRNSAKKQKQNKPLAAGISLINPVQIESSVINQSRKKAQKPKVTFNQKLVDNRTQGLGRQRLSLQPQPAKSLNMHKQLPLQPQSDEKSRSRSRNLRLYEQGLNILNNKERKLNNVHNFQDQYTKSICTFKPNISRSSRSRSTSISRQNSHKGEQQFIQRYEQARLDRSLKKQAEASLHPLSVTPRYKSKSRSISQTRKMKSSVSNPILNSPYKKVEPHSMCQNCLNININTMHPNLETTMTKRSVSRNKSPNLSNTKSTGIINLKPMIFPSERPVGHAGFQSSPARKQREIVLKKKVRKHNVPNALPQANTQTKVDYARAKLALRASLNNN